jgi:predicted dehydrogenase
MNKIKLIHVGLGRSGFDWAQHVYPRSHDVEAVAYVDKEPEALGRAQSKLGASPSKLFPTPTLSIVGAALRSSSLGGASVKIATVH